MSLSQAKRDAKFRTSEHESRSENQFEIFSSGLQIPEAILISARSAAHSDMRTHLSYQELPARTHREPSVLPLSDRRLRFDRKCRIVELNSHVTSQPRSRCGE